jgi:hypothetical protein
MTKNDKPETGAVILPLRKKPAPAAPPKDVWDAMLQQAIKNGQV